MAMFGLTALKTWYARVTRSRLTLAFFFSMLANFVTQITLRGMLLTYFARHRYLVTSAINAAGVQRGFAVVRQGVLEICSGIPTAHNTACHTVYNGLAITAPQSIQCVEGLTWLENYLINSKSEQILFLVLESWLLVTSLIALMDESTPHLIVMLAAQFVNTGWIPYLIARDISAKHTYETVIVNGTCGGFDTLGSWHFTMFYVTLGCSIASLFGMSLFVFKLIKLYSKSKLSSVGSSLVMNRMLKWRLWMRVFLQFTSFFTLASAVIWYDKRESVATASGYSTDSLFDVGFYVVAIITLPWLVLGAHSISKENRLLFVVFAILSMVLLVISSLWYGSALYRYEYWDWRTFACVTTMADGLLIITCALSIICRLNFGKGLAHFLVVERNLQDAGFAYDTFLNDPSDPRPPSAGDKRILDPVQSTSDQSQCPFKIPDRPFSECSVESAVFATWLSHAKNNGDLEKCGDQTIKGERLASTFIIPAEDMRPCSVQSVSDDGSDSLDELGGSR